MSWLFPKPKPPVPPPPPLEVHLGVWDEYGHLHGAEEGISVATLTPAATGVPLQFGPLLAEHRLRTVLPSGVPYGGKARLRIEAPNYIPSDTTIMLAQDIGLQLIALPKVISPTLRTNGGFMETFLGMPATIIGCSDFKSFTRYVQEGAGSIIPVWQQRKDLGFNDLRIFAMCDILWRFHPQEVPDYFTQLGAFCRLLGLYGFTAELTILVDVPHIMPTFAEQQTFADNVYSVLRQYPWMRAELVNEVDQANNVTDASKFSQPSGLLWSRGSNGGSFAIPPRPWGSYENLHFNMQFEWWRKAGHNSMEATVGTDGLPASGVPTIADENTRPDQDTSLFHFEDAAHAATLLCAGFRFHSNAGKFSELYMGAELDAATVCVRGAKATPLEFQRGAYYRRDDVNFLRVYGRRLPDGRVHEAFVRF